MEHLPDAGRTLRGIRNSGQDGEARAGPLGERARLTMANAATEARAGNYEEALSLLSSLPGEVERRPEILDLRARILAQQGRYREAEAEWLEASQLDPGNTEHLRGIDAIRRERRFPIWARALKFAAVIVVLVSCFAWLVAREQPEYEGAAGQVDALRKEVAEIRADIRSNLAAVLQRLERVESGLSGYEASPQPPRAPASASEDAPEAKG